MNKLIFIVTLLTCTAMHADLETTTVATQAQPATSLQKITFRPYNQATDEKTVRALLETEKYYNIENYPEYINESMDTINSGFDTYRNAKIYTYMAQLTHAPAACIGATVPNNNEGKSLVVAGGQCIPDESASLIIPEAVSYLLSHHTTRRLVWFPKNKLQEDILEKLHFKDMSNQYVAIYALDLDNDYSDMR